MKMYTTECPRGLSYVERQHSPDRIVTPMKRKKTGPGFGMRRYTNSGQAMRAMLALPVITGNIGKPGARNRYGLRRCLSR